MRTHRGEQGSALILFLGMAATLVILATLTVMMLANQEGATARDRSDKTSMDYAEAGLDSAISAVKAKTFSTTLPFVTETEMGTDYNAAYPSAPALAAKVYDDAAVVGPGTPAYDANADGKVWVEAEVTYVGRTTRLREMVVQTTQEEMTGLPQAVLFSDQDVIATSGSGDIYAVNPDGTPDTSGPPYQTDVTARGRFTGNALTNLAAPGATVQSLGVHVNGSVSLPGIAENGVTIGGVPLLSDYFNQAAQAALMFEAQSGGPSPGRANPAGTAFPNENALRVAPTNPYGTYDSTTKTFTADKDLVFDGNLTLSSDDVTYNFRSLYVTGDLRLSSHITTNATALYVGGDFVINNPISGLQQFASIFVAGEVNWRGGTVSEPLSVRTTNYTDPGAAPGPLWTSFLKIPSGVYNVVLGPTWVVGNAGTSDVAVQFAPTSGSTLECPLLATTEKITSSGPCSFGSIAKPMVLYMVCDNDSLYTNTCEWGSTGTFTGLMVLMEAQIRITGGNGLQPSLVGALFCAFDVTLTGASSVCYNQAVIDNVTQASLIEIVTERTTVPGTWQELSPN